MDQQKRVEEYFKSYMGGVACRPANSDPDPVGELIKSHTRLREHMMECRLCNSWWCRSKRWIKFKIALW